MNPVEQRLRPVLFGVAPETGLVFLGRPPPAKFRGTRNFTGATPVPPKKSRLQNFCVASRIDCG